VKEMPIIMAMVQMVVFFIYLFSTLLSLLGAKVLTKKETEANNLTYLLPF